MISIRLYEGEQTRPLLTQPAEYLLLDHCLGAALQVVGDMTVNNMEVSPQNYLPKEFTH